MSRAWWERPLPGAEAFAGLCADVGDVVRCGPSGDEAGGGRGLFATAAVAKGATIFREKPAVLVTGAFVAMPVLPSVFNFWFVFTLLCSL